MHVGPDGRYGVGVLHQWCDACRWRQNGHRIEPGLRYCGDIPLGRSRAPALAIPARVVRVLEHAWPVSRDGAALAGLDQSARPVDEFSSGRLQLAVDRLRDDVPGQRIAGRCNAVAVPTRASRRPSAATWRG